MGNSNLEGAVYFHLSFVRLHGKWRNKSLCISALNIFLSFSVQFPTASWTWNQLPLLPPDFRWKRRSPLSSHNLTLLLCELWANKEKQGHTRHLMECSTSGFTAGKMRNTEKVAEMINSLRRNQGMKSGTVLTSQSSWWGRVPHACLCRAVFLIYWQVGEAGGSGGGTQSSQVMADISKRSW